jgi:hypothetical protein
VPAEQDLSVWLEATTLPFVALPALPAPEDRTALRSAIEAVSKADHLGLFVAPGQVMYAIGGWAVEILQDAAHRARKDATGRPIFTRASCELVAEELGMELDEDIAQTIAALHAHHDYLVSLEATARWKPNQASFRAWRVQHAGSPLHALVERLLDIARQLDAIPRPDGVDLQAEGDCCALMVGVPAPPNLFLFDGGFDNYGAHEIPQLQFLVSDARTNPGRFWAVLDSVVLATTLITDAANAITTYVERHQPR